MSSRTDFALQPDLLLPGRYVHDRCTGQQVQVVSLDRDLLMASIRYSSGSTRRVNYEDLD